MRIALVHNAPSGGAKRAIYEWTKRLATHHVIDAFSLSSADHEFCDIRPLVVRHQSRPFTPGRLFDSPLGRLNQLQRWRDLGRITVIGRSIAAEIDAAGYDVIFAHVSQFTFIPACLAFTRTPSVYYLHEPFGRQFRRKFDRPYNTYPTWRQMLDGFDPLIRLYHRRLSSIQKHSVQNTTRFLANSRFTAETMRALVGIEAPVSHYGVEFSSFAPITNREKGDFLLSVGEMSPRKGFDFLIRAVGHLPEKNRPQLKIASNSIVPEEYDFITNLARAQGVMLEVLERQDGNQLLRLYNRAQACVYAPVKEPFGLVPLESMACGTPVIGVAEGGVTETVIHEFNGLLTDRHPAHFAGAIQRLLDDPAFAAQLGSNGRRYVLKQWSWGKSTAEIAGHLEEVAAVPGRRPIPG